MINIFTYTNYREYLKDYFSERKKHDPKFSHRWLAQKLELATSNFIMLVMQGKRNLNHTLCLKLSEVFKHSNKEAEYFEQMVNFMQAKTNKEKDIYFSRMAGLRKNLKIDTIEQWQYEYYTNWYNPVIRELVAGPDFNGNTNLLARSLQPPVTPTQAKRSIKLLLNLGLIKKNGNKFIRSAEFIATGPEIQSLSVVNFHKTMGELAVESLDRIPKNERNITSSTIYTSGKIFNLIRDKIENFRKEILELVAANADEERVYQINFQLFPVSKPLKNKEQK